MSQEAAHSSILLLGINAKYIHASFGLRCIQANLGPLKAQSYLLECEINQRPAEIVEKLLDRQPKIIGIGVYIWNVDVVKSVVGILKAVSPQTHIILGGPEVSFEMDQQAWLKTADHVVTGEGEVAFRDLCERIMGPGDSEPFPWMIPGGLPDLGQLEWAYPLYLDEDLAQRVVYVEASRGCPFTCEFCLSSLDTPVRGFDTNAFLEQMQLLLDRGLKHFKFVDRTFNLNLRTSQSILDFFLERMKPGLFLHFEMIPDRLPGALRERIAQFPAGSLQLEIGIQTLNPVVSDLISRRQNVNKLCENLHYLRTSTHAHLHVDLIAGLPGEDLMSFGKGFNQVLGLDPQEIQIGILKRLRGTPITRHDRTHGMIYDQQAPYEVLKTADMTYMALQRVKRLARYWDLVANSGNFTQTVRYLCHDRSNPFEAFLSFSDWLFQHTGQRHGMALTRLLNHIWFYLTEVQGMNPAVIADSLWADYRAGGRSDIPICLRDHIKITKKDQSAAKGSDAKVPLKEANQTNGYKIQEKNSSRLQANRRQSRHDRKSHP